MGKKKNPGYWERRAEYRQNTPICQYCGRHNAAGDHKRCFPQTAAGKELIQRREQEAQKREQVRLDSETWDHPEAVEQRKIIEATYGGKPESIADFWLR